MRLLNAFVWLTVAVCCTALLTACESLSGGMSSPFQSSPPPQATGSPPSQPGGSSPPPSMPPSPAYYDFQDVPIPSELSLVYDDSFVFQSGKERVGLLVLKGRVDPRSLVSFFQAAMPRENWKPRGGFHYRRSVLVFEKPEKTCVINIFEKLLYTYIEIFVAPADQGV